MLCCVIKHVSLEIGTSETVQQREIDERFTAGVNHLVTFFLHIMNSLKVYVYVFKHRDSSMLGS